MESVKIKCLSFHHGQYPWIFTGLESGDVEIWDYTNKNLVETVKAAHDGACNGIDVHQSRQIFASGGDDTKVKIWNYDTSICDHTFCGHTDSVSGVQFHPRHDWILSSSNDRTLRLWDWKQQTCILVMKGHTEPVMSASFHPRKDLVVSASMDNTLRVWDVNDTVDGTVENTVEAKHVVTQAHEGGATCVSFHRSLLLIVSGGNDKLVKLWSYNEDLADREVADSEVVLVKTLQGHLENVSSVLFNENRGIVVSASEDKSIRVWDVNDGTIHQILPRETDRFFCLDSEGSYIAAGHDSGLFVFETGSIVFKSEKASREEDGTCTLVEFVNEMREEIRRLKREKPEAEKPEVDLFDMCYKLDVESKGNPVNGMSFHNGKPWVLACFDSGEIELYDYEKNTLVQSFSGHQGPVHGIDFHNSELASIFVSGGSDHTIKVWNCDQPKRPIELVGHDGCVRTVKFHHLLPWVVSASDDCSIRIWNFKTGKCICEINCPTACTSANFHPTDNLVIGTVGVPADTGDSFAVWDIGPVLRGTVSSDLEIKYMGCHDRGRLVNCASFHPTEQSLVVSGGDDHEVRLWRMDETVCADAAGKPLFLVNALRHRGKVSSALFVAEQQIIVSASQEKSILVWDIATGTLLQHFPHQHRFWNLAVHPKKNFLAAAHDNGMIVFKLKKKDEKVEGDANENEELEVEGDGNEKQEVEGDVNENQEVEGDGSRSEKVSLREFLAQDRDGSSLGGPSQGA